MILDTLNQSKERWGLARSLFADDIVLAVYDPLSDLPAPLTKESACLSPNAVEKRRREFAAGRAAAHDALTALGEPVVPILVGEDRAPIWPPGVTGSISHTKSCAMAVAALQDPTTANMVLGLGIDIEEDTPLAKDLWRAIRTPQEQEWARTQANPGQMAKLIFSAKEAAYKCQYATSRRYYGFDGMELEFDVENGSFRAYFCADQPPFRSGDFIAGRYAIGAGLILTAAENRQKPQC